MFAADSWGSTEIVAGILALLTPFGAGVWRFFVWVDGKASGWLTRQDQFLAKLESRDDQRMQILTAISTQNALTGKSIENIEGGVKEIKEEIKEGTEGILGEIVLLNDHLNRKESHDGKSDLT